MAVAGQGTAALLYATDRGRSRLLGVVDEMRPRAVGGRRPGRRRPCGTGLRRADGVVAAIDMARQGDANPYGVPGRRWVVEEGKPVPIGCGQHGGLGPDETRPFLMIN